jgi:hypothetical protein
MRRRTTISATMTATPSIQIKKSQRAIRGNEAVRWGNSGFCQIAARTLA